ncbi:hypothetical protein LOTGIDRAFT_234653 [Lottia gigantea]|uniref:Uncharacterized protein n=1 Tax=Lottia gigantea TaxID=225164 RepID=V3ZVI6_LOTGI|nr:hypothetical protein LOTGIDRAFT_234653 [Lottia gigantea]ESO88352.1 hypothetical protein LOTGIDRAFT_234653 [Lottia gigantea]
MEVHFDRSVKSPTKSAHRNSCNEEVFEGYSRNLPGLHEWTSWRTKLNSVMVDLIEERHRIFSYPKSKKYIRNHTRILRTLTEPNFAIGRGVSEFALSRAVHDYVHGEDGFHLEAESFLSFGIPRVKLRSNMSYSGDADSDIQPSPNVNGVNDVPTYQNVDRSDLLEAENNPSVIYSESTKRRNITKTTEPRPSDSGSNLSSTSTTEFNTTETL